uniref:Uncharacterized protein n=1 Tax=Arundo donax TaxID=35708 RepID=A0A0A9E1D1_ARUDO
MSSVPTASPCKANLTVIVLQRHFIQHLIASMVIKA